MDLIKWVNPTLATATALNITAALLPHSTGDLLLAIFAKKDGTGGAWTTASTGWSTPLYHEQGTSANFAKLGWSYKVAESSAEPDPVFATSVTGYMIACVICIQGHNGIGASEKPGVFGNLLNTIDVPTPEANCLVLQCMAAVSTDTLNKYHPFVLPEHFHRTLFSGDSAALISLTVAAKWQPAAGDAPIHDWEGKTGTGVEASYAIVIKTDGSGIVPAYQDATSEIAIIDTMRSTSMFLGGSITTSGTNATPLTFTPISGVGTGIDTVFNLASGGAPNYFHGAISSTPGKNTLNLQGFNVGLYKSFDLSSGIIYGTVIGAKASDVAGVGASSTLGLVMSVGVTATARAKHYTIAATDADDITPGDRIYYAIQPGQATDTTIDETATGPALTGIDRLQFCSKMLAGVTTNTLYFSQMLHVKNVVVAGGSATYTITFGQFIRSVMNAYDLPLAFRQGASAALLYSPVIIGGGDPVHVSWDGVAIQYPESASTATGKLITTVHTDEDFFGLTIKVQAGDTFKLTNSVHTSATRIHFTVDATASASADLDFKGLSLINNIVSLRPILTWAGIVFADSTITQNNSVVAGCTFADSLFYVDNPSNLSGCTFTSGGTGHVIVLTTPGSYTLDGLIFTGYGANDSTDAAIYNNSGGAVTLSVSGGGSTPTVRNGAGASTTLVAGASLTISNVVTGSDVVIYQAGTTTVRATGDAIAGTTFVYGYESTESVDIGVFKAGYKPYYIRGYALTTSNSTLPVAQTVDRSYAA